VTPRVRPGRRGGVLWPWTFPLLMFVAAAAALVAALVIVDRIGERMIVEEAQAAATAEHDYLVALGREEGLAILVESLNRRERLHGGGFRYSLTDAQGKPLAGVSGLTRPAGAAGAWRVMQTGADGGQTQWQVVASALPSGARLQVAQNLDRRAAFRTAVFRGSALAILLASGACIAVGLALNGMLLSRARAIADTAARIAAGDLRARVATHEPGDVFDRLGLSINQMLGRIEELMTGMRTVTDSLAHDLRTPLTRLKGALARAMAPGLSDAERIAAVEQAQAEADRALATFSALLDIAQAETGLSRETMTTVDLGKLVPDVAELFGPLLEDAGQSFRVETPPLPVMARAHELLLRQAIGNLLHNASRHAGEGAEVVLALATPGNEAQVIVADNGPGVPEADRGRVQERFVRLDKARSTQGAGLGLAIVAACAKLHDGAFVLEDNHPGLRAVLTLGPLRS
jgi:signal transduction histidine kinase